MNVVGKICLGLTAALVLNPGVRADDLATTSTAAAPAADSGQPYSTIMARNVFGLVPIPPPPPPDAPPVDPPPKITANGIMDVFGELQALFKVSTPPRAGLPAQEQSYMLSTGQRQDDIEVTKIDQKAAIITFDNHGTVQEIPLTPGADSGAGGAAPQSGFIPPPPSGAAYNPGLPHFGSQPGMQSQGLPPGNSGAAVPQFGGNVAPSQPEAPPGSDLTPEEQALLIETERARLLSAQDQGQKPEYPPAMLPPTKYTPAGALNGPEEGGGAVGGGGAAGLTPP